MSDTPRIFLNSDVVRFAEATRYSTDFILSFDPASVKTDAIRPIAAGFQNAILRVDRLGSLPIRMCGSLLLQSATEKAIIEVLLRERGEWLDGVTPNKDRADRWLALVASHLDAFFQERESKDKRICTEEIRTLGRAAVDHYMTYPDGEVAIGIQSVLSAMLVDSWTACELLCTDLWREALNCGPSKWTFDAYQNDKQAKSFDMELLNANGFNLQGKLGTIMLEKLKLVSLKHLKEEYCRVFGESIKGLLFSQQYRELELFEAMRHLFAHRAGIIDQKLIWKMRDYNDIYEPLPLGEPLEMTGPFISRVVSLVASFGRELISYIDARLCEVNATDI